MSFPCILIILAITLNVETSSIATMQSSKTLSSLGNKFLHKASKEETTEYITFVDKPTVSKESQVALINQLLPIAAKLASMREYIIPDHIVRILNMIFEAITSVLLGPHTDVYWPLFTNALLMFMNFTLCLAHFYLEFNQQPARYNHTLSRYASRGSY